MYNPINMVIEDEQRLNDKDMREKAKKRRYEMRKIQEDQTRVVSEQAKKKAEEMAMRKVSHMRVREEIERGFDILTND